ncbi:MAG: hypothetical protein ACRBF0_20665 [Calditrichia bacterium]
MLKTTFLLLIIFLTNACTQDKISFPEDERFIQMASNNTSAQTFQKDSLWQKAVDISVANVNWLPQKLEISEVTKDNFGKIEEFSDATIAFSIGNRGEVVMTLVSTRENGEDTTEKRKRTFTEDQADYLPVIYDIDPFTTEHQKTILVTPLKKTREINGKTCSGYKFSFKVENTEKAGIAWLHADKGYPAMIETTYPDTVEENIEVSDIKLETYYHVTSEGFCYPDIEITTMNLSASSMLFSTWNGNTRIEVKFNEYVHLQ